MRSVDCIHMALVPPLRLDSIFRNREMFHSINAQVICNAKHVITNVVAKCPEP